MTPFVVGLLSGCCGDKPVNQKKSAFHFLSYTIAILLMCLDTSGQNAFAQFLHEDAETVDKEYYDTEYYFDIFAYRYSLGLENTWNAHEQSYRSSFGSIDGSHFYRSEDLKMKVREGDLQLEYLYTNRQDFVEHKKTAVFKVSKFVNPDMAVSILNSADFYKKWADAGIGFELFENQRKHLSLQLWSIDPVYNIKEENKKDKYETRVWNVIADKQILLQGNDFISVGVNIDTPVVWNRKTLGYVYQYSRNQYSISSQNALSESWKLLSLTQFENKLESRDSSGVPDSVADHTKETIPTTPLSLNRKIFQSHLEARLQENGAAEVHTFSLNYMRRDARYNYKIVPVDPNPKSKSEWTSGLTDEFIASAVSELPIYNSPTHFTRLGASTAFINEVTGNTDRKSQFRIEAKVHTGYEFRLSDKGVLGLHISWDADNWARKIFQGRDYEASWDGGNFQFAIGF